MTGALLVCAASAVPFGTVRDRTAAGVATAAVLVLCAVSVVVHCRARRSCEVCESASMPARTLRGHEAPYISMDSTASARSAHADQVSSRQFLESIACAKLHHLRQTVSCRQTGKKSEHLIVPIELQKACQQICRYQGSPATLQPLITCASICAQEQEPEQPANTSSRRTSSEFWSLYRSDSGSIAPDDIQKVYDAVIVAAGIVAVLIANVAYVGESNVLLMKRCSISQ